MNNCSNCKFLNSCYHYTLALYRELINNKKFLAKDKYKCRFYQPTFLHKLKILGSKDELSKISSEKID